MFLAECFKVILCMNERISEQISNAIDLLYINFRLHGRGHFELELFNFVPSYLPRHVAQR